MKKKRISSLDLLLLIIVSIYLIDMDFEKMNTLEWVATIVCFIWLILFIIKHLLPAKKECN